jgi:hypothetical protein
MIIDALRGCGHAFMAFDDKPVMMDRHCGGRFWMVRSIRNSPLYGPQLFAAMNDRKRR